MVLVASIGEADSQTAQQPEPQKAAEMARSIAHVIDTKTRKTLGTPIVFESATSHDNVVELHYVANELGLFPHNDAEREQQRLRAAYRFCFDRRMSPLDNHGVIIHQTLTASDGSAPFEFIIDEPLCTAQRADVEARAAAIKNMTRSKSPDDPTHLPTIRVRPSQFEQK